MSAMIGRGIIIYPLIGLVLMISGWIYVYQLYKQRGTGYMEYWTLQMLLWLKFSVLLIILG